MTTVPFGDRNAQRSSASFRQNPRTRKPTIDGRPNFTSHDRTMMALTITAPAIRSNRIISLASFMAGLPGTDRTGAEFQKKC